MFFCGRCEGDYGTCGKRRRLWVLIDTMGCYKPRAKILCCTRAHTHVFFGKPVHGSWCLKIIALVIYHMSTCFKSPRGVFGSSVRSLQFTYMYKPCVNLEKLPLQSSDSTNLTLWILLTDLHHCGLFLGISHGKSSTEGPEQYCSWKKSCTSWYSNCLTIDLSISTGLLDFLRQQHVWSTVQTWIWGWFEKIAKRNILFGQRLVICT